MSVATPCDKISSTITHGIGPEFIYPFLVLFFATILRKIFRHYNLSLPYTVVLMLVGAVLGAFYQYELIKRLTFIADLTPVQILAIFLPILIFENFYVGFLISVALTTLAVMYWYENEHQIDVQTCWTWDQAVLYSAVVSATDPVSVVSLLKSMTSLKTLSTVIEGESLLNDAAAITIYTLIKDLIHEAVKSDKYVLQQTRATLLGVNSEKCAHAVRFLIKRKITPIYLLKFVLKTIAAAILIGYIMAHITICILYRIDAGELETCITIIMSYFVYLTCEAIEASGVIGVVLLGLTLNMNRACFSVSAVTISEQTWQLLAYVANSLIFITVGVILLKTHSGSDKMLSLLSSLPQLLLIYIILISVRAIMILCTHFLLKQIAYGFTWKDSIVTIWSGLRGGVSLVLALTLFNSRIKENYQAEIMLIHTTAVVFLTCTVNALTIPKIVHILRLDRTSELIKQTMMQIIKELKMKQNDMIRSLKKNPILATADWMFVQKAIDIRSPFDENKEDRIKENLPSKHHIDTVECDHCQAYVTIPISKSEFRQTFEDCRIRILRLQKTHFWSNYYNGQLSSYGLHTLNALCDRAIDTPKAFIDLKTIKAHIVGKSRIRSILNFIRTSTRQWQKSLSWHDYFQNQSPTTRRCFTKLFHCLFLTILIILIECTILTYQIHTNPCNRSFESMLSPLYITLEIVSSLLVFFDSIQFYFWFSYHQKRKLFVSNLIWMILYMFSVACRCISCIIHFIMIRIRSTSQLCLSFYIFKSLSLIECFILCFFLIEPLQLLVDYILNQYISVSYDIGLAYISSEEQVLRIIHRLTDNESIRIRIHELSLQHIKSVLNDVLLMQEAHPGTVISIKTHHTINLLYNTAKRGISQIRIRGVLDTDDCDLLEQSLKNMRIQLHIPSTMPSVSPMVVIQKFSWLYSNQRLTDDQKHDIEQLLIHALPNENTARFENETLLHPQSFSWQDFLWHKNDQLNGVYLLVNGIVEEWKLDPYDIDAAHSEVRWKENHRTRRTTLPTQQILKPYGLIRSKSKYIGSTSTRNMNSIVSDLRPQERSVSSIDGVDSTKTYEKNSTDGITSSSEPIRSSPIEHVRISFEDGFYIRWYHRMINPIDDKFTGKLIPTDDGIHQYYHPNQNDENFDEYFDETFEKYRQMHPATSERVHRRYSSRSGHCIGLYDLLFNNGEKHESTAKCVTNVTAFFLSKQKLLQIFNTYALWDIIWLETSIHLALRILPNISSFQHSSTRKSDKHLTMINKRLLHSGLLIYTEGTCTTNDIIQLHEDLLLVTGSVRNQLTKCVYEAPVFIKSSLTKQGLKLLEGSSSTKILVLPRTSATINLFTDFVLIQSILNNENKYQSQKYGQDKSTN
ncbi:unnamed protein product [Adineta ricciae]|uniref:Cation/H+ exchanger transmembrane domain-containing protein n=1 Tax=Adineta ricciae TaxID=249248 RepID=A0A813TIL0_ADIRI|nr:unnamed protein product [Adineta ricciae]